MSTVADRVKETTTSTGTGTINLGGAVSGFQLFVSAIGNGVETYYCIEDASTGDWEVGRGVVTDATPDTLSRVTVLDSSNGGSLVSFSAGSKNVFVVDPAGTNIISPKAYTALPASTEFSDVEWNLNRTVQFATGAITNQRAVRLRAPTYSFVGASVITNAATLYINAAPTAGTNATITNNYALFVDAGNVRIDANLSVGVPIAENSLHVKSTTGSAARLEHEAATTNASLGIAYLQAVSTADMVDNFGSQLSFGIKDTALVSNPIAYIKAIRAGADNSGSLLFGTFNAGAASDKMLITKEGNVGLGTATPDFVLEVGGQSLATLGVTRYANIATGGGALVLRASNGTEAAPTAMLSGERIGNFVFGGYNSAAFSNTASISAYANENYTASNGGTYLRFDTSPDGTATRTERLRIQANGDILCTQGVSTTGSPTTFKFIAAAHTTLTLSVEAPDIDFGLARTVQFATGALANQRAVKFSAPTYAFVGASTITNAATVYISGAPVAGTNATLTKTYALWVDAGEVRIDGKLTVGGLIDPTGIQMTIETTNPGDANTYWSFTGSVPKFGANNLLMNVVEDLTPQLGANLDTNAKFIDFDHQKGIRDSNGNELLLFSETASSVNYLDMFNSTTGTAVRLASRGGDANIDLELQAKGTGKVLIDAAYIQAEALRFSSNSDPADSDTLWWDGAALWLGSNEIQFVGGGG